MVEGGGQTYGQTDQPTRLREFHMLYGTKNISTISKIFMTNVIFLGFLLNNSKKFTKQKLFLVKNWLGEVPSRAAVETF